MPPSHTHCLSAAKRLAETLPFLIACQQQPCPWVRGVSVVQAAAVVAEALCVPAVPPLQESRWVSDRLCAASLKGRDSSNKAGIRDLSVCGAHATPLGVETQALSTENESRAPAALMCPPVILPGSPHSAGTALMCPA